MAKVKGKSLCVLTRPQVILKDIYSLQLYGDGVHTRHMHQIGSLYQL